MLPQIHLNGSGKRNLIEERLEIRRALNAALDVMKNLWPHPRDYPIPEFYVAARHEHRDRMKILDDMQEAYWQEAMQIDEIN